MALHITSKTKLIPAWVFGPNHQVIFYGSPGSSLKNAIENAINEWSEETSIPKEDFQLFHTTFHPATTYDHFVRTEKTFTRNNSTMVECISKVFMKAYDAARQKDTPVILVIEDIHRGNVPKIFGEFYTLLDRVNGESEYSIELNDQPRITTYHSLPNNFFIWATMTTGEEALFTMDHSFQRKWHWKYVPINYAAEPNTSFCIGDKKYQWNDFLKAINHTILEYTHSEEKQMGENFRFKINSTIDFKNEIMGYLWHSICKDNYGTERNFFRYYFGEDNNPTREFSFRQLFTPEGDDILENFLDFIGCPART
jgi:type II restriction-modification system restriction subunit